MTGGEGFAPRWLEAAGRRTGLVLGVAPSAKWLAAWGLPDTCGGAEAFCTAILAHAAALSAVKLQTAFFERFGCDGFRLIRAVAAACRAAGTLVIADAKRNDAEDTASAYADVYLGPGSQLECDGVTVVPFMGMWSALALSALAEERGCSVMVLIRTSNHRGGVQSARNSDGTTVAAGLARGVAAYNAERRGRSGAPVGPLTALVGAEPREARDLLTAMPGTVVSLPGLGRAGRTFQQFTEIVAGHAARVMLPVTSGLLSRGPHGLGEVIAEYQDGLRSHQLTATR
jgi:orotidine-5'-phosphate decarboxylase